MYIWSCVLAAITLCVLDIIWIMTFMGKQYRGMVLNIQKEPMIPNKLYAIAAYCLMIFGLIWFVMKNIDNSEKLKTSAINGLAFGITLNGVYNTTAGAIFKKLAVANYVNRYNMGWVCIFYQRVYRFID